MDNNVSRETIQESTRRIVGQRLINALEKINVERHIIREAILVYESLPDAIHKWKDSKKFYLCATEAYNRLLVVYDKNIPLEEIFIFSGAKKPLSRRGNKDLHTKIKDLHKQCFRLGFRTVVALYEPKHFLWSYMLLIGMQIDHLPRIDILVTKYINYSHDYSEELPQDVAAAAVYYYGKNKGYDIDEKQYQRYWKTKKVSQIIETIGLVDNITHSTMIRDTN